MSRLIQNGELMLYGTVGFDWWECFTAPDIMMALGTLDPAAPLTVRINSGGGDVQEGIAIANMLKARPGEVTCVVDAVAASAASIIALGGDTLVMRPGTLLMIHDPATVAVGNVDEISSTVDMLEAFAQSMAAIYAAKTGQTVAEARAAMKTETWYTAEGAVTARLADEIGQPVTGGAVDQIDADPDAGAPVDDGEIDITITIATPQAAAFPYAIYASAPKVLADLAAANNWTKPATPTKPTRKAKARAHNREVSTMSNPTAPVRPTAPTGVQTPAAPSANVAAEIAALCATEGVPIMASALIREGVTLEQATARVNGTKDVRAAVEAARRTCPQIDASLADTYIAAGKSIEGVRADLFDRMAAVQAVQVSNVHQPSAIGEQGPTAAKIDAGAIYAQFNKRAVG